MTKGLGISSAQKIWSDFLLCGEQKEIELNLISCIESIVSSKTTRLEKTKLTSYLIMEFYFSALYKCDDVSKVLPAIHHKDEIYFCMDVLGKTVKFPGYIAFVKENKKFKLKTIKYVEN